MHIIEYKKEKRNKKAHNLVKKNIAELSQIMHNI